MSKELTIEALRLYLRLYNYLETTNVSDYKRAKRTCIRAYARYYRRRRTSPLTHAEVCRISAKEV